jgi:triphosphoribosyl-dephospho-CoA synthase
MSSSPRSALEPLADALAEGLWRELCLTPKPGLVDLEDSGSHRDLTFATMERSIGLVRRAFAELAASLEAGEPLARQVAIGQRTERRMLRELGTNTHKGALFLGGLLLVGRRRAAGADDASLRAAVAAAARELPATRAALSTHGEDARRQFGVGGIVAEALAGLPSLFDALAAFREARRGGADLSAASFAMLARLMQTVEDTTALHRCGLAGLVLIRDDGARLQRLLERSGDHVGFLRGRNALYRRLNLTMGGVADLLGMGLGQLAYRGEIPVERTTCVSGLVCRSAAVARDACQE